MIKCPCCNRIASDDTIDPGVKFVMPDHLNYLKNAQCPASGVNFVNTGDAPVLPNKPRYAYRGNLDVALSVIAFWGNQRPIVSRRR